MQSSEDTALHRVFVYGTLKSGQPNHAHLEYHKVHAVGTGQTEMAYPLVISTHWNLPFLLYLPGKGQKIYGEIYDINDKCFKFLDDLEGHPGFYERRRVRVEILSHAQDQTQETSSSAADVAEKSNDDVTLCWVYFLRKHDPSMLKLEMLSCYDSYGSHSKPYVPEKDDSTAENFEVALSQASPV